jgi:hypothetical protein
VSEELLNDECVEAELEVDVEEELQMHADEDADVESEFEEISSDEVDRVVDVLEELASGVESENIKTYLEEALNAVYYLVYEEEADDEDEVTGEAA